MSDEQDSAVVENANDSTDIPGADTSGVEAPPAPQGAPAEGNAEKQDAQSQGTLMSEAQDGETPKEGDQEKKPEEEKPKGAPESYEDFKAPEGAEFAEPVMTAFKGVAKELDLSQDQAQKLIDTMTPVMQKRYLENIASISAEWRQRTEADPEIGGEKFQKSQAAVARLRETFARNEDGQYDADILEFMNSPMGNHPGAFKLLARAGAAISEASFPTGGKAVSGPYTSTDFYRDAKRG